MSFGDCFQDVHASSAARMSSPNLQNMAPLEESRTPTSSSCARPVGAAHIGLDDGFLQLSYVKSVENVDSYDLDVEVS